MATITTDLICNLNQPVAATFLHGNLFSQDNAGNTINVHVMDNGEPATIGGTVSANVIRADGNTVAVSGSLSGNHCSVVLPQACYAVPGRVEIIIKLTQSTTITTIAAIVANVYRSTTDTVVDPGTIIPSIQALIEEIEDAVDSIPVDYSGLLATIAADYSSSKTYQVGQYAWQGGVLKRCIVPITTAETYTAAHWTNAVIGDDLSALKSAIDDMIVVTVGENLTNPDELYGATIDNTTGAINKPDNYYVCSGHIPCTPGETLYILWYVGTNDIRARKTTNDKLAFYKEDGTFISIGYNEDSYTVPELAAYCIQQGYKAITEANTVAVFRVPASSLGGSWLYYTETRTLEYSYTPQEVLDRLNTIDDCMKTNDYLDYSMVNRLNPSECAVGKSVGINSGEIYDNATNFTTGFMEIRKNETLYLFSKTGNLSPYVKRFAAYDKDKNVLPSLGLISTNPYIVQSGDMAYIRVSFVYYAADLYRTPNGVVCIATQTPQFMPGFGASPVIKSQYLRPVINVFSTDTEAQIITKLVNAYNISNCDVYFERASYSFGTELAKVSTDYGMDSNEIPIGNGCRYFFNGSHLTATIDLSQHPASGNDEFYCNFFGCQRRPSSYEMYDGVLEATDTRYVVHDESSALKGSYRHLYQNMEMHYHTNLRQEDIRKCIGGGTGASGVVEIVGCKFTTDATDSCVSYHGNSTDVAGAEFDLNVRDSWFSNGLRCGALSANQTARLFYTGNSAITEPTTYDRWTVTKFLNEVRN